VNIRKRRRRNKAIQDASYRKFNPEYDELKPIIDDLYKRISNEEFDFGKDVIELTYKRRWWRELDVILYDTEEKPEKLFTFIMALKNRSKRALNSIKSIVNSYSSKYIDFIIVEDTSDKMLEIPIEYQKLIDYNIVDTKIEWSKSPLLNFGIKRTKTPLCVVWDCDFIFPDNFIDTLLNFIKDKNIKNQFFCIPSFETHDNIINDLKYKAGDPYGDIWVYPTNVLMDLNGFNEKMIDHSAEDIEMEKKIYKYLYLNERFNTYPLDKKLMVFHHSHLDKLRTKKSVSEINRKYNHFLTDIKKNEDDSWGQLIKIN
tara:strand:+ start:1040 stop:1981 length:942 start_codon:yes stop_codon:yes gene_type:complete